MIKYFTFILLIETIPTTVFAQEEVTVKDPEIEFRFTKPNGWKTYNDEYYYYVFSPTIGDSHVSITYIEAGPDDKVEDSFDFALKYFYPNNEPGFKIIETGNDIVNDEKAKWVKYQSSYKGIDYLNILYMFMKNGQTFKVLGSAREDDFDKLFADFIEITKSIKSQKI